MDDHVVALVAICVIFGLPMIAWIIFRTFRFIERLEMIKRGMVPPSEQGVAFPGRRAAACGWGDDPQLTLYKGVRLASIGLALFVGLSFIGGTPGSPGFHGGPWLLGGLIPLFVGLAQIALAVLSGARFSGGAPGSPFVPPPPPQPPRSAAWQQPGRRPEELEKPPSPPDLRRP